MRKWSKRLRLLVLGCATIAGAVGIVWFWVIPELIVAEIRKHHEGHVTFKGWWLSGTSAGVTGLTLHESPSAFSPVWVTAERVTTDVSIGSLLRGRWTPRRITILAPRIVYRIGEDGRAVTVPAFKLAKNGPTPAIVVEHGRLTLAQAGRPEMVVETLSGSLAPDPNGARLRVESADAGWGCPIVEGRFGPSFQSTQLRLTADPLPADRERAARVPFVSKHVWDHFLPTGPIRVVVDYERSHGWSGPAVIKTVVDFEQSRIDLPHLQLTAQGAVGRMIYEDSVVRLEGMRGEMVDGRVAVSGTLDFRSHDSRYDLTIGVVEADLIALPAAWGLEKVGMTGTLTGTTRLNMTLTGQGLDLTGSTGSATIDGASIRGIRLGRFGAKLRGEGLRADASKAVHGVFLPQWIGADFDVPALELKRVVAHFTSKNRANEVPVSGSLGVRLTLRMPLGRSREVREESLADPRSWSGTGRVEGFEVGFGSARFQGVSAKLALKSGRLNLSDIAAKLDGHPLNGAGEVNLTSPHDFRAKLDAADLPLAQLVALASSHTGAGKVSGTLEARAEASGSLSPWRIESRGRGTIDQAKTGRFPLGDLPIAWETEVDNVVVTAREIDRYGGRLSASATIPVRGDRPVEGTVTLSHIDTAQLSAEAPGSVRLTGLADGQARFRILMNDDGPSIEGEAKLTAPEMTVAGIPAKSFRATIAVHDGVPKFEAHAEGLSGTFAVKGSGRFGQDFQGVDIDADVRAIGLQLASLCDALGVSSGPLAKFQGLGEVAARVRTDGSLASTQAEGSAEVSSLRWGDFDQIGHVRSRFVVAPDHWQVKNLEGALWDSPIEGEFWRRSHGGEPAQYGLNLRLGRISLPRVFAFDRQLAQRFEGWGELTAEGHAEGSFRGRAEFRVEHGRVHKLPILGLSIPIDWDVKSDKSLPGKIRIKKATARVAGGRLFGEATIYLGLERSVHAELTCEQIDMRAISRVENLARRPMPGVIDGFITLDSHNIASARDYTGKIDMDLTGAALVDIPILDRLDSALGSAQGAVFDDGDLHGHIAHRAIHVDRLTLVGPLAQLHATGTIGFDGRLDLRALINTNDIIPSSGQIAIGRLSNAAKAVFANQRAIERMAAFFSSRLMKFRIRGTVDHPSYAMDGSMNVDRIAIAFFVDAMRELASRANR